MRMPRGYSFDRSSFGSLAMLAAIAHHENKEPRAEYALEVPSLMPQLRLFGHGGRVGGDGEPPKSAFRLWLCRTATPWKVIDVTRRVF